LDAAGAIIGVSGGGGGDGVRACEGGGWRVEDFRGWEL
jgi:hypothetical protein